MVILRVLEVDLDLIAIHIAVVCKRLNEAFARCIKGRMLGELDDANRNGVFRRKLPFRRSFRGGFGRRFGGSRRGRCIRSARLLRCCIVAGAQHKHERCAKQDRDDAFHGLFLRF